MSDFVIELFEVTKGMEELPIDQVPILKFCKTSLDPYKRLSEGIFKCIIKLTMLRPLWDLEDVLLGLP